MATPLLKEGLKKHGYIDYLEAFFVDCYPEEFSLYLTNFPDTRGHHLFTYEQARSMKRFVDTYKHKTIDRLLIHCDAGISRSGAVAVWAYKYLYRDNLCGFNQIEFWRANKSIDPNQYVAKVLCEISDIPYNAEDFSN